MNDSKKHILIAEDENNLATSLYFILTAAKYHVSIAHNGKAAYAMIENSMLDRNPVDLLVSDVLMPEMNGEQLLAILKKKKIEIPTLIITGYGDKEMIVRLMRLGCNDFVDKPFEPETILQRVESIFSVSSEKVRENRQKDNLARIGEKTSQIAHDLKNVLGGTLGYADMALDELGQNHPAREMIEKLHATTSRASEICLGMLAKAKEPVQSFIITTEINSLVQRISAVLKDIAPEKVFVEVATLTEPLWLKADGDRLQQAILNLGFNAFNAMQDGGTLSIAVACESAKHSGHERNCVVFTVADTGRGIPSDTIDRIFNEGFTTCENGHGMGLSCVRKIVEEEHDGWIEVKSAVNKGTTFRILLPTGAGSK